MPNNNANEKRLINTKALAFILDTTENGVWAMKARGLIPERLIVKVGRSVRYDYDGVVAWLNELKTVGNKDQQGGNTNETPKI